MLFRSKVGDGGGGGEEVAGPRLQGAVGVVGGPQKG